MVLSHQSLWVYNFCVVIFEHDIVLCGRRQEKINDVFSSHQVLIDSSNLDDAITAAISIGLYKLFLFTTSTQYELSKNHNSNYKFVSLRNDDFVTLNVRQFWSCSNGKSCLFFCVWFCTYLEKAFLDNACLRLLNLPRLEVACANHS